MSQATGPFPVVAGAAVNLKPPADVVYDKVVLTNLSPLLLQIQAAGEQRWLAPWTEAIFEIGRTQAPVVAIPTALIGATMPSGAGSQIQTTWYQPGEQPAGVWPISLAANALAATITSGVVTVSGDIPVHNGTPSPLQVGGTVSVGNFPADQLVHLLAADAGLVALAATLQGAGTGTLEAIRALLAAPLHNIPDRASTGAGRTYKTFATTSTVGNYTAYTVTGGKTLYLESLTFSLFNTNAAAADVRINDGAGTVRIPVVLPGQGAGLSPPGAGLVDMVFPDPKQFTSDVRVVVNAGTVTSAIAGTGYEA